MALTQQRVQELYNEYGKLKDKINEINHKYSLDVYEIDLGFPPTLGLEKLTFTPKTPTELANLVAAEVDAKCGPKIVSAEKTLANQNAAIEQQKLAAGESNRQKIAQIDADYSKKTSDMQHKIVNANLQYSTLFDSALKDIQDAYAEALELQQQHYASQNESFQKKADANMRRYQQEITRIQEYRMALTHSIQQSIRDKEQKQALAVQKYNNSVDEKENKYQYSCKRATEYAREAEVNRALAAARLYATLGSTGLELRKKTEKYYVCLHFFGQFTKEEAKSILSFDSFLKVELEDYYSTLVDWINNYLY